MNPPGIQDWETTAAAWLLDLVPEYRQHAAGPWRQAVDSSGPNP